MAVQDGYGSAMGTLMYWLLRESCLPVLNSRIGTSCSRENPRDGNNTVCSETSGWGFGPVVVGKAGVVV